MPERPTALKRRIAPSVPFTLRCKDADDKDVEEKFVLCLDTDALCALEEKIPSLNTLAMGGLEIFREMNSRVLAAALWAAVLRHHPEYDTVDGAGCSTNAGLRAIGSFIDSGNSRDVIEALGKAYLATLPKERAEQLLTMGAGKGSEEQKDPMPAPATPAEPAPESLTAGSSSGASAATISDLVIAKPAASA